MSVDLVLSPALTIPADELRWTAVRSSGPGGQNVNKVSSKVELRFDFQRSKVLAADVKERLRTLARGRLDGDGHILIFSQATRDRQRNLEDACAKLGELILRAFVRPKARRPSSVERSCFPTSPRVPTLSSPPRVSARADARSMSRWDETRRRV